MTQEQIAHEELITREDQMLGSELIDRINAGRQRLRKREQPMADADAEALHDLLGLCALELSAIAHERQENQVRLMTIARLMQQMITAEESEVLEAAAMTQALAEIAIEAAA
jgi:hypothetical protein